MTDAALISAAIVVSSGAICAAIIAQARSCGQYSQAITDEIRSLLDAKDQLSKTERAMAALYHDNHAVLRDLLRREQECIAREQANDYRETA